MTIAIQSFVHDPLTAISSKETFLQDLEGKALQIPEYIDEMFPLYYLQVLQTQKSVPRCDLWY